MYTLIGKTDVNVKNSYGSSQELNVTYMVKCSASIDIENAISNARNANGIPKLFENAPGTNLYAVSFDSKLSNTSDDFNYIDVTVQFLPFQKMENNYLMSFRSSMQSINTVLDFYGQPVKVGYTYPDTEQYVEQLVSFDKFQPTFEMTCLGISTTNNPLKVVQDWQGATNADTFYDITIGQLLCTSVNFEMFDAVQNKYKFQFIFQGNVEQWDKLVWFVDNETGKIPDDLVYGVGYKNIQLYKIMNFNDYFPFKVEN